MWITRLFSLIDVGLSRCIFFGFSHTLLHSRTNCNTLQIGIHVCDTLAHTWIVLHTLCMHIVCTLNAVYIFVCCFRFCCSRSCCDCAQQPLLSSFASMAHSMLDFVCIVLSMCLSDNIYVQCTHVFVWVPISFFFSFCRCVSLDCHAKVWKKPISFWMCISFIWKRRERNKKNTITS